MIAKFSCTWMLIGRFRATTKKNGRQMNGCFRLIQFYRCCRALKNLKLVFRFPSRSRSLFDFCFFSTRISNGTGWQWLHTQIKKKGIIIIIIIWLLLSILLLLKNNYFSCRYNFQRKVISKKKCGNVKLKNCGTCPSWQFVWKLQIITNQNAIASMRDRITTLGNHSLQCS